jgi:hypothetical protein
MENAVIGYVVTWRDGFAGGLGVSRVGLAR